MVSCPSKCLFLSLTLKLVLHSDGICGLQTKPCNVEEARRKIYQYLQYDPCQNTKCKLIAGCECRNAAKNLLALPNNNEALPCATYTKTYCSRGFCTLELPGTKGGEVTVITLAECAEKIKFKKSKSFLDGIAALKTQGSASPGPN